LSKRVNVILDDDNWEFLGRLPTYTRNRAINEALRAWITGGLRTDAVRKMVTRRGKLPKISMEEVMRWVGEDREHGR
jgi:hypothetical protein